MSQKTRLTIYLLTTSLLLCCGTNGEISQPDESTLKQLPGKKVKTQVRQTPPVKDSNAVSSEKTPPAPQPEAEMAAQEGDMASISQSGVLDQAVNTGRVGHLLLMGHGRGGGKGRIGGVGRIRKKRSHRIRLHSRPLHSSSVRTAQAIPDHNTKKYVGISEQEFKSALDSPLSTFSIDVDTAAYANVRRFIEQQQRLPPADAVRIEELINYFSYDYPDAKGDAPFSTVTEVSQAPWNPAHRLVHIGIQGRKIDTSDLPPTNLVFLLDVSGSMAAHNKLPLLKKSLGMLVANMRSVDRVSIVVYAGAAGLVLPPTAGNDKPRIMAALDQLRSGGSTAGAAGIQLAYQTARESFIKGGNNRVILATDGDFNVGTTSTGSLEKMVEQERESGVFLTVLGFGMGNYKDGRMETLSNKGNGNAAYIDSLSEARKVLVEEMGGTLHTIAKDVKIQVEFNPAKVKGYRLIGYVNRALANRDFNDDKKDAGELGAGHTVTVLYEIIPVGSKEQIGGVDELKYQKRDPKTESNELLTLKLRYKHPQGKKSALMTSTLMDETVAIGQVTNDFRFAAAVAEFGLLLRGSKHRGQASFDSVFARASSSLGNDSKGHRSGFLKLVRQAQGLVGSQSDTKQIAN